MLGPSGSGKTTTLRMIAGFELPTAGRVLLHGQDVTGLAPFERDVNTVFQDYALFPHMTVARQRRLRPRDPPGRQGRARPARRRGAGDGPPRGLRQAQAGPAVGRPAPAGRARARAREPAPRPAARRAARRARPQAPRGDAGRAQGHPAAGRDHVHLRHPRPGGGAHDERPDRGLQPRPDRAGGRPGRGLREARDAVRGGLRRHLQPADRRGRTGDRRHGRARSPSGPRRSTSPRPPASPRTTRWQPRGGSGRSCMSARIRATSSQLEAGAELVVTEQNLRTTSTEALAQQGREVRLIWKRQHCLPVADGGAASEEEQDRMKQPRILALAGVVALLAAACSGGASGSAAPTPARQSIGEGEGRSTWSPGPATPSVARPTRRYDWVTPFETKTGCKVSNTDMTDSNNGVSLMQSGEYDGISASGDATTRLIAGGIVAPVEHRAVPELRERVRGPQGPAAQHRRRRQLRRPARPRPEPARVQHRGRHARAHQLGSGLGGRLRLQGQDQRLRLVDLHRRRGAAPDDEEARARASRTRTSSTRRSSPRRSSCSRPRRPTARRTGRA